MAESSDSPFGLAANLLILAQQRNALREALERVEAVAGDLDEAAAARVRAAIRGDDESES